ncbi:MAG: ATP-binding cassette domain-containing protein [Bacilli bacterium]|nr:ATP-binding cassette domain-containing protein [Bacilli bacterium]
MEETILKVRGISKSYRGKMVLKGIDMNVHKGDIYGFVGRNGAGKTTLIRIIAGLAAPSGGEFDLFGISSKGKGINKARRRICAMVESPSIYPELSAKDNLRQQCQLVGKGYQEIGSTLEFVGLKDTGKKKAADFSLGMRQRLAIGMALIGEPELMLLDEPMNGLDPEGIKETRELLVRLSKEKRITILISSHILGELSLLATTYGFIDDGRMVREVTAEEIKKTMEEKIFLTVDDQQKAADSLEILGYRHEIEGDRVITDSDIDIMKVCERFKENGVRINKIQSEGMELEDYFLSLIERRQ